MIRKVIIRYTLEASDSKRIRAFLKSQKISIRSLARFLGYSATYLCDVLNGKAYLPDKFHVWINVKLPFLEMHKIKIGRGC